MPTPTANELAETYRRDFFAADQSITWTASEQELHMWLSPNTVLMGTIDAQGITESGDPFFCDFKTISPFYAGKQGARMEEVKAQWKIDPQSLSYGVLLGDKCHRFTVRWIIKGNPVTTDFAWYDYTSEELGWWKIQLIRIADEIRTLRYKQASFVSFPNWPTNLTACARYGWSNRCPLYDEGCSKLDFNYRPNLPPRDHHIELEQKIRAEFSGNPDDLVVLSSSSVEVWLSCQQKYKHFYEGEGLTETSGALQLGTDTHKLLSGHINSLIKEI